MALVSLNIKKPIRPNKINNLSGKEWIKFTKSWFVHNPPKRDRKIQHPASFPESLVSGFIEFFTKPGQIVLDPFLGTGSSLISTKQLGRHGVGIEIYKKYAQLAEERISNIEGVGKTFVINGDSRDMIKIFRKNKLPKVQFCITSPPYWTQLMRSNKRQKVRKDAGLSTIYGDDSNDIGTIIDYQEFLQEQKKIFDSVYEVMDNFGYLVVITNNVYYNKRMYPLAFDTVGTLSEKWVPKDEKIWCQDGKPLWPFGIFDVYVGNRHHHYCLIFRKESV